MKIPPTQAHANLRAKLHALAHCEGAHRGEREGAGRRLVALEAKYDFTLTPESDDVFSGIVGTVASGTAQKLMTFDSADSDIAALAQWALSHRYKVSMTIRTPDPRANALWVEADAASLPALRKIADHIRAQFSALWRTMAGNPTVTAGDRRPFLLGLYDGMMDDPRAPGSMLPARSFPDVQRKGKKKALALAPGLAVHPYTLALDLGRRIRLRASVAETTKQLTNTIAGVIEDAAA